MHPLRAVVKNGRLVVDEPTELPDGTHLILAVVEERGDADDLSTVAEALGSLPLRRDMGPGRHDVIAERARRVLAGEVETLSLEETERSIRRDLDV